jgi:hypothetical protein
MIPECAGREMLLIAILANDVVRLADLPVLSYSRHFCALKSNISVPIYTEFIYFMPAPPGRSAFVLAAHSRSGEAV